MATNVTCKWLLLPVLSVALLAGGPSQVEGAKPKPPASPPVLYNIRFWAAPEGGSVYNVNDMNNLGQIVGWYYTETQEQRAFLYDPASEDPSVAIDLNVIASAPEVDGKQMVIASAVGINDKSVIVGYLQPVGTSWGGGGVRRGFALDTKAENPAVILLPEPEGAWARNLKINNNGDVLETYRCADGTDRARIIWAADASVTDLGQIDTDAGPYSVVALNNNGQVALQYYNGTSYPAYRWSPPNTFDAIGGTDTTTRGINDLGTVCGGTYAKPPKGRAQTYPYRWNGTLEVLFGVPGTAAAINSDSDLFVQGDGRLYVYQNATRSFFDVDSLIDPKDPGAATWSSKSRSSACDMTERIDPTGFGQLAGTVLFQDANWGYLLTPKLPTP